MNFIFFFSPLSLLFLVSCTKYNYKSSTNGSSDNISQEKPFSGSFIGLKNSSFLRKSNLETLALGRNRMEIEKMMGPPDGRSLDGGNGYWMTSRKHCIHGVWYPSSFSRDDVPTYPSAWKIYPNNSAFLSSIPLKRKQHTFSVRKLMQKLRMQIEIVFLTTRYLQTMR